MDEILGLYVFFWSKKHEDQVLGQMTIFWHQECSGHFPYTCCASGSIILSGHEVLTNALQGSNTCLKTFRIAEWGRTRLLNHDALPAAGAQTASQWIFAVHAPKNTTAQRGRTNVLASRFIIKLTQSKVCQTHVNGWRPQLWYKECSKGNLVLSKMVE